MSVLFGTCSSLFWIFTSLADLGIGILRRQIISTPCSSSVPSLQSIFWISQKRRTSRRRASGFQKYMSGFRSMEESLCCHSAGSLSPKFSRCQMMGEKAIWKRWSPFASALRFIEANLHARISAVLRWCQSLCRVEALHHSFHYSLKYADSR